MPRHLRHRNEWLAMMAALLTRSAVDRLAGTCHELIIEGDSYRRRQRPTITHPKQAPHGSQARPRAGRQRPYRAGRRRWLTRRLRSALSCGYHSAMAYSIITVGHGTATQAEFTSLLHDAEVTRLVDVRRYPASRVHPHAGREALARWLPAAGISYRWEERLGGRRRLPAESPDGWWRVEAFRAYAHHMRSTEFLDAFSGLLTDLTTARTVVMCSESLWWRCHRRLIADFATLARGIAVYHLDHGGRLTEHPIAAGARLRGDGLLVYDLT